MSEPRSHREVLTREFERFAPHFGERTRGRFDALDPVGFSRVPHGSSVAEVGSGTASFLSLFADVASRLVAVDLTPAMLRRAQTEHPGIEIVVGDAERLPLQSGAFDVVASAQMLHHVWRPVPIVAEMARVAGDRGRVLIVDQVATEKYEEAVAMSELERLRDPSHAVSRPPSAFRIILRAAELEVLDERVVETEQRMSTWMWPGEFPEERFATVRRFIDERGEETGMGFERAGDDYVFTRRRIMLLARPA